MSVANFVNRASKVFGLAGLTLLLAACGAGGGAENALSDAELTESATVINGTAVKGVIENGIVRAYRIENNAGQMVSASVPYGESVRSNSLGQFSLQLPASQTAGALIVEISADSQTTMKCDVVAGCGSDLSGNAITFGSRFALDSDFVLKGVVRNVIADAQNSLHITSLSHLAVAHAEGLAGGLTSSNIDTAYRYVESSMGLDSGALQQAPADLTRLDQLAGISKSELEVALMSASFLALVNSPDWNSIDEILDHASQKMSVAGSLTSANLGALPDVAMDDLYYQAGEIAQALMMTSSNAEQTNTLTEINDEFQLTYSELTHTPEEIAAVAITGQPDSVTVDEYAPAGFSVTATGGGELTYQWRKDGVNIDGAVTSNLSIASAEETDAGVYDVIVTNSVGSMVSLSVLLTVNAEQVVPNSNPVAVNDTATTSEDTSVSVEVLANDSDADGDSLSISTATATFGTVNINSDNSLTYVPEANFNGQTQVSYIVSDGNGGSASGSLVISVTAENDNPVAVNDSVSTSEDTAVSINVISNDGDVDGDSLSLIAVGADKGSVAIVSSNTLNYVPAANESGSATITYTISDGQGGTATAVVSVAVGAANDEPVAVNDSVSTDEDVAVTIDVLANDSDDDGDSLTVSSASSASGSVTVNGDDSLLFTPVADFSGTAVISYTISDGQGGTASASVNVTVDAINDQPLAENDTASTVEDLAVTINVLANDSDVDGDSLTVSSASATSGSVSVNGGQALVFTPASNFNGTVELSYTISDGQGGSATASASVTVSAVNDQPVAANDAASTTEDNAVTINVLANDSDVDGDSLTVSAASASSGTVSVNGDQSLSFTPAANFNGSAAISYTISDGNGSTATAAVNVTVSAVNDQPVATNDVASTDQEITVNIDVLVNDTDIDGDALSIASATASNGTITLVDDGTFNYTPANGFSGEDSIAYVISDGQGGQSSASVTVTVNEAASLASIELTWDIPTERENGDSLELYEIDGYRIAYGSSAEDLSSSVYVSGALVVSHVIENLSAGTYYFAIATVDSDDTQGAYSSTISVSVL